MCEPTYLGFALSKYKILWQFFTATSGSVIIKSVCCVVKILDTLDKIKRNVENSDNILKCTEYGLDTVGLMAQYRKLTNIKRKEVSSFEFLLCPIYTEFFYGDDIPNRNSRHQQSGQTKVPYCNFKVGIKQKNKNYNVALISFRKYQI